MSNEEQGYWEEGHSEEHGRRVSVAQWLRRRAHIYKYMQLGNYDEH
jgi:hypothetical protein